MANISTRASQTGMCCFPPISVIHHWPMTIVPVWHCCLSRQGVACTQNPLQLPLSFRARNDRCANVACRQRGQYLTDRPWTDRFLCRRWRRTELQAEPPRQCPHRSGNAVCTELGRQAGKDQRFQPLWLRRTPILFARIQSSGRAVPTQRVRNLSEYHTSADNLDFISPEHLALVLSDDHGCDRYPRDELDPDQSFPERRASTWQAWPLFGTRRRQVRRGNRHGLSLGPQSGGWQPHTARYRTAIAACPSAISPAAAAVAARKWPACRSAGSKIRRVPHPAAAKLDPCPTGQSASLASRWRMPDRSTGRRSRPADCKTPI